MIRQAEKGDHVRLKDLWALIFGDSPAAIDAYFTRRHKDEDMLVYAENGVLCGMLSMLPLTLLAGGTEYPARYVYAVATDPGYRGRGIASMLLEHAHEVMKERGTRASVLVPASESLFGYYEKRGYRTAFTIDVKEFAASELPPFPSGGAYEAFSPDAYARMRDAAFWGCGLYASWDARAVAFASEGANLTYLTCGGGAGCALWEKDGDEVLVRELALFNLDVSRALAVLHACAGATSYRVRLQGNGTPFGMIKWLIPEPAIESKAGYLSLALD